MNKDQLRELLEGLTTSFAEVANTIANTKKEPEDRRELTHMKVNPFHGRDDEDPIEWLDLINRAFEANNILGTRRLAVASAHLSGLAALW